MASSSESFRARGLFRSVSVSAVTGGVAAGSFACGVYGTGSGAVLTSVGAGFFAGFFLAVVVVCAGSAAAASIRHEINSNRRNTVIPVSSSQQPLVRTRGERVSNRAAAAL